MRYQDVAIPVTGRALADRGIDPAGLDGLVLGWMIPQRDIFYGAPKLAARLGAAGISGPMISWPAPSAQAGAPVTSAAGDTGAAIVLEVADR